MIPSPLTILMTTDAVGGVWTYSADLCSELASRGHDVHLVTMGPAPSEAQRAMLGGRRLHLHETALMLEWQDPEGEDVSNARRVLRRLEDVISPDLVHLNSYREAGFGWRAPVVCVAHSCVLSWSRACDGGNCMSERKWRHYAKGVSEGFRSAQAWVAPSRSFHEMVGKLHCPPTPGRIIWNGLSPRVGVRNSLRERRILAAGRMWDKAKNMAALVEASHGLDWPARIAGSVAGTQAPSGQNVTLLGDLPRERLLDEMSRSEIFVSPAYYEPFGLTTLEAAAAGCALVLSDIPTFRELWNEAAIFVSPDDPRMLNDALARLAADGIRRRKLQHAASTRARRYTLSRTVDAYLALYGDVLAQFPDEMPDARLRITA